MATTVDQDNEKQQTPLYRGMIIGVSVFLIVMAWWALIRLNHKIFEIRSALGPTIKTIGLIVLILILLILAVVFVINLFSKSKQWNEKKSYTLEDEEKTD